MTETDRFVEVTRGEGDDSTYLLYKGERIKGEYVLASGRLEDKKIMAHLFRYAIEGPPYTTPPILPNLPVPPSGSAIPTRYEVYALNALYARDTAIIESRLGRGDGFKVVWEEIEDGAPEEDFARSLVGALKRYDDMVAKTVDHLDWEVRHGLFIAQLLHSEKSALSKVYGQNNVEMELRFRAMDTDHWQAIAPAVQGIEGMPQPDARSSLVSKFKDLLETLTEEEATIISEVAQGSPNGDILEAFLAGESLGKELGREAGASDWIGLKPQSLWNKTSPGQVLQDLTRDFQEGYAYPTPEEIVEGESAAQGYGTPFSFPGIPHLQNAFAGWGGMPPFNPGPEEAFTMGDGEERDQRQLEAAVDEADGLRAALLNKENSRRDKIDVFKNTVVGGLHWLIEKIEGTPGPIPEPPLVKPRPEKRPYRQPVLTSFGPLPPFVHTGAVGEPLVGGSGEEF